MPKLWPSAPRLAMSGSGPFCVCPRMKLPRFDGHGNSNEKREPDGSKKETHSLSRGVSTPGGGNGDPQRQDAGPSGARTGVQRIQSESLEEGVFEATGAGRD